MSPLSSSTTSPSSDDRATITESEVASTSSEVCSVAQKQFFLLLDHKYCKNIRPNCSELKAVLLTKPGSYVRSSTLIEPHEPSDSQDETLSCSTSVLSLHSYAKPPPKRNACKGPSWVLLGAEYCSTPQELVQLRALEKLSFFRQSQEKDALERKPPRRSSRKRTRTTSDFSSKKHDTEIQKPDNSSDTSSIGCVSPTLPLHKKKKRASSEALLEAYQGSSISPSLKTIASYDSRQCTSSLRSNEPVLPKKAKKPFCHYLTAAYNGTYCSMLETSSPSHQPSDVEETDEFPAGIDSSGLLSWDQMDDLLETDLDLIFNPTSPAEDFASLLFTELNNFETGIFPTQEEEFFPTQNDE